MRKVIGVPHQGYELECHAGAALGWVGARKKVDGGHKIIIVYHLSKSRTRGES